MSSSISSTAKVLRSRPTTRFIRSSTRININNKPPGRTNVSGSKSIINRTQPTSPPSQPQFSNNDEIVNSAIPSNNNNNNTYNYTLFSNNGESNEYAINDIPTEIAENNSTVVEYKTDTQNDSHTQIIIVILSLVVLSLLSLSLVRLKNRSNDKKPITEKGLYDVNKPLPVITEEQLNKLNQVNQQSFQLQNSIIADTNYNNNINNSYLNPNNAIEYNQQQQQYSFNYDNRISFLALGDSAIEPRKKSLALKEEVIKKSENNLPIPLIHINNKKGPNANDEESEIKNNDEEDNINLKAVEPLPDTVIPSIKKSPQNTTNSFLQESHDLFKKISKGVKNVGNRLKQNSISSTKSTTSTNNNRYSVLSSPKI
ncbi:hypothetical protein BCR32DRAFT_264054 [Anaeromyces robustus]|uniref:Uncharacterized protein n=1 Tax=Anaeromyces robustus TaxID=1754192 RepID=A0A1Y1XQ84_9FUNG|nr:hypothetical protein BCR32DRAFT_264054 [Anaeromyces robustus]|eukprot:ORX87815.1 hypothetical protein BCR32DRAFT_264054 [Anaeromyces robustus]